MGQPATLIIDIETVGQELDAIPERAREILLDSGAATTDEERQKILDGFGLDPCTGRIICIGLHWMELDRSRVYCQTEERELLANFWSDIGQIRPQRFVTFNGKSFDFPYINIRSAILGIPIPRDLFLDTRRYSTDRH
ncbi:MAG TPA: 3'-5' exonuclease, partial [Terriglobia bacterium]|nr:3'-5' exonuclease [Terriglobia bacterium]